MNSPRIPFSSSFSSSSSSSFSSFSIINLSTDLVSSTSKQPRRVHFSDRSELIILDKIKENEGHLVFYTQDEMASFRHQLVSDVRAVLRALDSGISDDVLGHCIGIEAFLSPELARRVQQVRISHLSAVMEEQHYQRAQGCHSRERLAAVSEASSRWSRKRAHELAMGYFEFLSDS